MILEFVQVPPSHWSAVMELEQSTRGIAANIVQGIRGAVASLAGRPLNVHFRFSLRRS